jgi:protease II
VKFAIKLKTRQEFHRAGDNKTIFYTTQDANTLRSDTVLKHKLGTDTAEDEVVYFEKDDTLMLQLVKKNQKIYFNQFFKHTDY